jgi:hypothetical protein
VRGSRQYEHALVPHFSLAGISRYEVLGPGQAAN